MSSPVTIRIQHQAKTIGSQLVQAGQGRSAPWVLQAQAGHDLQLIDQSTGRGPRRLFTQRVGSDLHVSLEGGELGQPDVIVKGYFQQAGVHVLGQGADGQFYSYVAEAGPAHAALPALGEAPMSAQVLGSADGLANPWWSAAASGAPAAPAAAAGTGMGDALWYGALGLGGLGLAGAAAGGRNGNGIGSESLAAPTVSVSANGLKISGTAPAGATVQLDLNGDGVTDFTAVADASGNYSLDLMVALVDGQTVSARAVSASGASSPTATGLAPDFPMLVTVSADGAHAQVRYAAPGATVTITDAAGQTLGSAVAGADGTADVLLATPQLNGQALAVATATEHAQAAATDTTPPGLTAALDAASNTGALNDNITADTTPTLSGDSEPGARISVVIAGQTLATVAASNGTWSVTPGALAPGSYNAVVTATDAAGNVRTEAVALVVDLSAPTFVTAALAAGSDGGAVGDGLTNINTPTFAGTAEPGAHVTVVVGGQSLATTVAADGTWSVTPGSVLVDGSYTANITSTNLAGNSSTTSLPLTIVTSMLAPSVFLSAASDSGVAGDHITRNLQPTLVGQGQPGASITVSVGGQTLSTTVAADGSWSVTPSAALAEGAHTVGVSSADAAGNTTSASLALTIDSQAPAVTAALATASDSGALGDRATNITTPTLTGTGEPGAAISVLIGGQTLTTQVAADGSWSVTTAPLAEGPTTASITTTDAAGNSRTAFLPVKIDTRAPAVAGALAAASDSGTLGDALTNDTTPTLSGTGEPGAAIRVQIGGQTLNTSVAVNGSWSVTPLVALNEGQATATITTTDAAGNSASTSVVVQIDTSAPALYAELSAASDTGTAGDNLTRDDTPTLSGFGEAGARVSVSIGGQTLNTTVAANGLWSVTAASLPDAAYTATVNATDAAGNTSSASVNLRIDTVSLGLTARLDPLSDSGTPGDGLTRDDTPTVSGTGEAGARIRVDVGGQWLTTTVAANGSWSVTPDVLLAGAHTAQVTQTDGAGNTSTATVSFSIDTVAPVAPLTTLVADLNNDGYLNIAESAAAGTLVARVLLPSGTVAGDTLRVSNGTSTQTIVLNAVQAAAGSVDLTFAAPADGSTLTLTSTLTDRAGNISLASMDTAVVDLSNPDPNPGTTTVTITTDADNSGVIDAGELGAATTVMVSVGLPAGAVVGDTVYVLDGVGNARNVVITAALRTAGTVQVNFPAPEEGADFTVTAQVVDAASNPGTLVSDHAVRDSFAATAPLIQITSDGNNDGSIDASELTPLLQLRVTLPTAGVPPVLGDTLTITDSVGATVALVTLTGPMLLAGFVDVMAPMPIEGASTTLTAMLTSGAGNSATSQDTVIVDTTAPAAPVVSITEDANHDAYVNSSEAAGPVDVSVALDASAAAGDALTVMDSRGSVTTVTLTAADITAQAVQISFPAPAEGESLGVWAFLTDSAGNSSADSATVVALWDTLAPAAPLAALASTSDTGVSLSDHLTHDNTPTISGTGEPGSVIRVVMPGTGEVLLTTVAAGGSWSVTPTLALADGLEQAVSVTQSDAAGNTSAASTVRVSVDTLAPLFTSASSATVAENTAASVVVLDVNSTEPVTYFLNGDDAARFRIDPYSGVITFNVSPDHEAPTDVGANNVYELLITAVDWAGNSASQSVAITVSDVTETTAAKGVAWPDGATSPSPATPFYTAMALLMPDNLQHAL